MTQKRIKTLTLLAALAAVLSLAGCAKKAAKVTPPPPPTPAPAPTATLAANPSVVQQGQSSVLTWQTSNANEIAIAGLGTVPASGSQTVMPNSSTTYELVAKGPGGTNQASTRITVHTPVPPAPPPRKKQHPPRNQRRKPRKAKLGASGSPRRSHPNHQLRQRKTILQRRQRTMLAGESRRSLRVRPLNCWSDTTPHVKERLEGRPKIPGRFFARVAL